VERGRPFLAIKADAAALVDDPENEQNEPAEGAPGEPLFKWETLEESGQHTLSYKTPIPGRSYRIDLTSGHTVQVWRGEDCQTYFCHGLTFGGKAAPGGPVSPFSGPGVATILLHHYRAVDPESAARAGDILVCRAPDGDTPHSAILLEPVAAPGSNYLDYASKLRTKNGIEPETTMTLEELITDSYGEAYTVYRRK
jgi:hypothetical protein